MKYAIKFATKIQSEVEMMLKRLLYVIAKSSCVEMTSAVQYC